MPWNCPVRHKTFIYIFMVTSSLELLVYCVPCELGFNHQLLIIVCNTFSHLAIPTIWITHCNLSMLAFLYSSTKVISLWVLIIFVLASFCVYSIQINWLVRKKKTFASIFEKRPYINMVYIFSIYLVFLKRGYIYIYMKPLLILFIRRRNHSQGWRKVGLYASWIWSLTKMATPNQPSL